LKKDPQEWQNLFDATEFTDIKKKMRQGLIKHLNTALLPQSK
jgi:hypothetical protein